MDSIKIFGVRIHNTTLVEVTNLLREYLKGDKLSVIYTPNTEIVMAAKEDKDLRNILNKADIIIPDGIGLIYGSKIKKKPLKERVTGFDTSMKLLDIANENSYSIFLLGGKDGVSKIAADNIKIDYPNVKIAGYQHGYFKESHLGLVDTEEEKEILNRINRLNPDIIFVGLGFPMQEKWIDANKDRLNSRVIIGNGGVIDILAGNAKRAPKIYMDLGLEWFYRLIKNPSRIKRQMAIPKFMIQVLFGKDVIE